MDTHFLPALNPHDKKILKAQAMNGPHVTGLINATVLCHRSQPILRVGSFFPSLRRKALLHVCSHPSDGKLNQGPFQSRVILAMQGLDGLRRGGRRALSRARDLTCFPSSGPCHLLPWGRREPRARRSLARGHQEHFFWIQLFVQPGLGFSHKGEMNPEQQSKLWL